VKATREQAALNREHVLEVGSQLFRERGYDGIGVSDLMRHAGQTHGAFYGQFDSKDAFIAEASARGFEQMLESWVRAGQARSSGGSTPLLEGLVGAYLSRAHRDNPGNGCMAAALGADGARQTPAVREVMNEGVEAIVDMLMSVSPGEAANERRASALATFSGLVGALTISRAVGDGPLSTEVLAAAAAAILARN
jgi:TetR/AcrR family transcriptional repressor of nem operon